ncbi:hypothetical protein J2W32_006509 [Variovorax boronicumulans]|uniref:Phage holin family protein n=1 Tax=Variovorax boronicumulans TaxID=436515 RepID=A0AAW8DAJ6_9BURK|nr:hypothetical protein [Variovorax boronicumulans]MDP9897334.1 hypothetical protein [Variovorax boronicumulans]MDQ0057432.1 hypothetical protein [Variovorax boronicumulans]
MSRQSDFEDAAMQSLAAESKRYRRLVLLGWVNAMGGAAARAAVAVATIGFWLWLLIGGGYACQGMLAFASPLWTGLAYMSGVFIALLIGPRPDALVLAEMKRRALLLEQSQAERFGKLVTINVLERGEGE